MPAPIEMVITPEKYVISSTGYSGQLDGGLPQWISDAIDQGVENGLVPVNINANDIRNWLTSLEDGVNQSVTRIDTAALSLSALLTTVKAELDGNIAGIQNSMLTSVTDDEAYAELVNKVATMFDGTNTEATAWFTSRISSYASAIAAHTVSIEAIGASITDEVSGLTANAEAISILNTEVGLSGGVADGTGILDLLDDVNREVDGVIVTTTSLDIPVDVNGAPIPTRAPYSTWTTKKDKLNHVRDIYIHYTDSNADGVKEYIAAYRFLRTEVSSSTDADGFTWYKLTDEDSIDVYNNALHARDLVDNKRRVFVGTPYTPYEIGDLWSTTSDTGQILKRATVDKLASESYSSADWVLVSTDDSQAEALNAEQLSLIKKYESYSGLIAEGFSDGDITIFTSISEPTTMEYLDLWRIDKEYITLDEWAAEDPELSYASDSSYIYKYYNGETWEFATANQIAVIKSTLKIAGAQALADSKIRMFNTTPFAPYEIGDMWIKDEELYRSTTTRTDTYSEFDWVPATKYTDDTIANTKTETFIGTSAIANTIGDFWVDTGNYNELKRWDGDSWESVRDGTISVLSASVDQALADSASALAQSDGLIVVYYEATDPDVTNTIAIGDIWVDIGSDPEMAYRWRLDTVDSTEKWIAISDTGIAAAFIAAQSAQTTADGKILAYYADEPPVTAAHGDLWYDTNSGNKPYYWDDTAVSDVDLYKWISIRDATIADAQAAADAADEKAVAAQADATSALEQFLDITLDDKIDRVEKIRFIPLIKDANHTSIEFAKWYTDEIVAQTTAYNITTEKATYDNNVLILNQVLNIISSWSNNDIITYLHTASNPVTGTVDDVAGVAITRTKLNEVLGAVYESKVTLLQTIALKIKNTIEQAQEAADDANLLATQIRDGLVTIVLGSEVTINGTTQSFADHVSDEVDGKIQVYSGSETPELHTFSPAAEIGDTYIRFTSATTTVNGATKTYNVVNTYVLNGSLVWEEQTNNDDLIALADIIDGKRTVYSGATAPVPSAGEAHQIGDVWIDSALGLLLQWDGVKWDLPLKYTDDSTLENFLDGSDTSLKFDMTKILAADGVTTIAEYTNAQIDNKTIIYSGSISPLDYMTAHGITPADDDVYIQSTSITSANDVLYNVVKTYIYDSTQAPAWVDKGADSDFKTLVDSSDGKRTIFTTPTVPTGAVSGDLWIPPAGVDTYLGMVTYVYSDITTPGVFVFEEVNKSYRELVDSLVVQADGQIQTFYQATIPTDREIYTAADTQFLWSDRATVGTDGYNLYTKSGDYWSYTGEDTEDYKKGNVYQFQVVQSGSYMESSWNEVSGVSTQLFDEIDGKSTIYGSPSDPFTDYPGVVRVGDIWIPSGTPSGDIVAGKIYKRTSVAWILATEYYTNDDALIKTINSDGAFESAMQEKDFIIYTVTRPTNPEAYDVFARPLSDVAVGEYTAFSSEFFNVAEEFNWGGSEAIISLGPVVFEYYDPTTNGWNFCSPTMVKAIQVLAKLLTAEALADNKARVFTTTPTSPYEIGDLWLSDKNILRSTVNRLESEGFHTDDWILASDYTNDENLLKFVDTTDASIDILSKQIDGTVTIYALSVEYPDTDSIETEWLVDRNLYDPSNTLYKDEHEGDLFVDTTADVVYLYSADSDIWIVHPESDNLNIDSLLLDAAAFKDNKASIYYGSSVDRDTKSSLWTIQQKKDNIGNVWYVPTYVETIAEGDDSTEGERTGTDFGTPAVSEVYPKISHSETGYRWSGSSWIRLGSGSELYALAEKNEVLTATVGDVTAKLLSEDGVFVGARIWDGVEDVKIGFSVFSDDNPVNGPTNPTTSTTVWQYFGGISGPDNNGWVQSDRSASNLAGGASKLLVGANGEVTGWSFADGSNIASEFKIRADKFELSSSTNDTYVPLTVDSNGIYLNGNVQIGGKKASELPQYLGTYNSDPVATNVGDTYFNDVSSIVFMWNGTAWVSTKGDKGDTGDTGAIGDTGSTGTRGAAQVAYGTDLGSMTIATALSIGWPEYGFTQSAGALTPAVIKGDSVILTNTNTTYGWTNVFKYDGSSWVNSTALTVHGDAVIDGTVVAKSVSADWVYAGNVVAENITGTTITGKKIVGAYGEFNQAFNLGDGYYCIHAIPSSDRGGIRVQGNTATGIVCNTTGGTGAYLSSETGYGVIVVSNTASGTYCTASTYGLYTPNMVYAANGYAPFTGSHIVFSNDTSVIIGDILKINTSIGMTINQSYVEVSNAVTSQDKTVYGVLNDTDIDLIEFINTNEYLNNVTYSDSGVASYSFKIEYLEYTSNLINKNYKVLGVNALGEGMINVCSINGDIENGDYITSSIVPGKGMKQDDDLLHNYTVAKSLSNIIWAEQTIGVNGCYGTTGSDGVEYKTLMVPCTYHCG